MVYCSKCGTQNADDANNCVKCGAPLSRVGEDMPYWRHRRHGEYYDYGMRRGSMVGIIIGAIIILIGFSFLAAEVYNVTVPWWEIILILVGIWLIARAVMRMNRRPRQ